MPRSLARLFRPVPALAILAAALVPSARAQELDASKLAFARPEAVEPWRAIGWRTLFGPAILEASAAKKPILLWAMNGHPLGCT